jgi:hypothetical protein
MPTFPYFNSGYLQEEMDYFHKPTEPTTPPVTEPAVVVQETTHDPDFVEAEDVETEFERGLAEGIRRREALANEVLQQVGWWEEQCRLLIGENEGLKALVQAAPEVTEAMLESGAQALANDVWHPPQPLASLSRLEANKFRRQALLVLKAALSRPSTATEGV